MRLPLPEPATLYMHSIAPNLYQCLLSCAKGILSGSIQFSLLLLELSHMRVESLLLPPERIDGGMKPEGGREGWREGGKKEGRRVKQMFVGCVCPKHVQQSCVHVHNHNTFPLLLPASLSPPARILQSLPVPALVCAGKSPYSLSPSLVHAKRPTKSPPLPLVYSEQSLLSYPPPHPDASVPN